MNIFHYSTFHRSINMVIFIVILSATLGIGLNWRVQAGDTPDHEQHMPEDDKDKDIFEELSIMEISKRYDHERR